MTYKTIPLMMKTKTNLHVGSESINYDIVDKTVQRDSITTLPVINASSSKGAMRYHFTSIGSDTGMMSQIFGKEGGSSDGKEGELKFLDTYLLFLPLRANTKPFYHVTSKQNLLDFIDFYEGLYGKTDKLDKAKKVVEELEDDKLAKAKKVLKDLEDDKLAKAKKVLKDLEDDKLAKAKKVLKDLEDDRVLNASPTQIEDYTCENQELDISDLLALFPESMKPENIAIFSNEKFIDACEHLPIIARNKVKTQEDPKGNLWYEEIVPRESIFYTAHLEYGNYGSRVEKSAQHKFRDFYTKLQDGYIQVGANASIGFGLCKYALLDMGCPKEEKNG